MGGLVAVAAFSVFLYACANREGDADPVCSNTEPKVPEGGMRCYTDQGLTSSLPILTSDLPVTLFCATSDRLQPSNCNNSPTNLEATCIINGEPQILQPTRFVYTTSGGEERVGYSLNPEFSEAIDGGIIPCALTSYYNPNTEEIIDFYRNPHTGEESPLTYENSPYRFELYPPEIIDNDNSCNNVTDTHSDIRYVTNEAGELELSPASILRGDSRTFVWQLDGLNDCNGEPLELLSNNLASFLTESNIEPVDGVFTITGKIKPNAPNGAMEFIFFDSAGHRLSVPVWLPTLNNIRIEAVTPYIQQGVPATFAAPIVPEGVGYNFTFSQGDNILHTVSQMFAGSPEANEVTVTFAVTGRFNLSAELISSNGETVAADPYSDLIHSAGGESGCPTPSSPTEYTRDPDDASMVRGSGTEFTWRTCHILDGCDLPMQLASNNAAAMLFEPRVIYPDPDNCLVVTGRILPGTSRASMVFSFLDGSGRTMNVDNYPPVINPLEIRTPDSFIQVGEETVFSLLQPVADARQYCFWVDTPGGSTTEECQALPRFTYTPIETEDHRANIRAITYNGEEIATFLPFYVMEGAALAECYSVPLPGEISRTPRVSHITRGDNTEFTFTISNLLDCSRERCLTFVDSNIDDILYGAVTEEDPSSCSLTFRGQIRSNIGAGSMIQAFFRDEWGNPLPVTITDMPGISEPGVSLVDGWLNLNEAANLVLTTDDPAGAAFNYLISRPDGTNFRSGSLLRSNYPIAGPNNYIGGRYSVTLAITPYDGIDYSVGGTYIVHD